MNKLLGFVNLVCMPLRMELISSSAVQNFHYVMSRLYQSVEVQRYLISLTRIEHKYTQAKRGPVYPEIVVYCSNTLGRGPIEQLAEDIKV